MAHPNYNKRYSDEEFALILRQAAELQESSGHPHHPEGLSLAEIKQVAREAGIDPRYVAEAAALLAMRGSSSERNWLGVPFKLEHERSLPGEVPDREMKTLLDEIRRVMEAPGELSHVPGALEWQHKSEGTSDKTYVDVVVKDGNTQVKIRGDRSEMAAVWFTLGPMAGVALGMIGAAAAALGPGAETAALLAGGGGLGLGAGWVGWRYTAARWKQRLDTLTERLTSTVTRLAESPSPATEPEMQDGGGAGKRE